MQKTAQSRGILNQLREKINMPGAYLEGFFKPELDRVMAALKSLDDKIRAELTGKQIGDVPAPEGGKSSKELLKDARRNFNRREYMAGLADLGTFHKKMFDITNDIDKFYVDVNKIHNKFLFEGLDDKQKERLKQLREHMERKAEVDIPEYFIKEAGIMDFFHNIGTKRGRSLMAWEKKYPKQTKELREWGTRLVDAAEDLLEKTIASLKQMATARAIRRPDDYMSAASKIKGEFDKFDGGAKGFRAYYNDVIVPFLKIKDEIEAKETTVQPSTTTTPPEGKVELGGPLSPPPGPPSPPPITPTTPPMGGPPGALPPLAPPPPKEEEAPITDRKPTVFEPQPEKKIRVAHEAFFRSLELMSQEDPRVLAGYISKYATSIQGQDPDTAVNLFALVRQIKG